MSTQPSDAYRHEPLDGRQVGRFGPLSNIPGLAHAITTRQGGLFPADQDDSAADGHYRELAEQLGCDDVAWSKQVHGTTILRVEQGGCAGQADGLITDRSGLAVLCRSADCALILAADTQSRCVGVAHASWRSTAGGIAGKLIDAMVEQYGVARETLVACVSPSAGPDRYEVGQDVYDAFISGLGTEAKWFFTSLNRVAQPPSAENRPATKKYLLDLWSANSGGLMAAGVGFMNIYTARVCTIETNDTYPSYRVEGETAGRFAAILGISGRS